MGAILQLTRGCEGTGTRDKVRIVNTTLKVIIPTPPVSFPENVNVIVVDLVLPSFATALLLPSTAESILAVEGDCICGPVK